MLNAIPNVDLAGQDKEGKPIASSGTQVPAPVVSIPFAKVFVEFISEIASEFFFLRSLFF